MNTMIKPAFAAALLATAGAQGPVALAQTASAPVVPGLAVANLDAVVANSSAFRTAQQQRPVTYKAQIDQAEARRTQLEAQIKPMIDKFNADRSAASPNQASLAQQAQTIQGVQQSGQQELQRILAPVSLSEAYVTEQIEDKLDQAVKNAMAKGKISLLLGTQAVIAVNNNAYNLNQAILTELNALIPAAQLTPPAGWEPREVREQRAQRAQQQAQAGAQAAPTPTPAPAQPQGR